MKKNAKFLVIFALIVAVILIIVGVFIVNKDKEDETFHYWKLTYIKNYDGVESSYKDEDMSLEYLEKNSYQMNKLITDLNQIIVNSKEYYYVEDGKMYYSDKKIDKKNLKGLNYYKITINKDKMTITTNIPEQGEIVRQYKEITKKEMPKK